MSFLVLLLLSFRRFQDRTKFYALFVLGIFLAINGVGIAVPPAVTNPLTEYGVEPWWLLQAGIACVPVALAICWVLTQGNVRDEATVYPSLILRSEFFWILLGLNLVFAAITLRFMAADGFDKVSMIFQIDSFESLYRERYSFDQEHGHGWFSSFIIYRYMALLTCGLILVYAKQYPLWIRYACTAPLLLITLLRSATELQRGPIITQLLLIVSLMVLPWILTRSRNSLVFNRSTLGNRTTIVTFGLFAIVVAVGLVIFQATHEEESAIVSLPRRVFVIPAHTAGLYFGLFPDTISFRGITGSFTMPLGEWTNWQTDTFNLKQIGYYANGHAHHPNANCIASAYTADGWVSVGLVSGVFIALVLWFNKAFSRVDAIYPALATIITFHGVYAAIQADFVAAVTLGFGISQGLMILAAMVCLRQDESSYTLGDWS